MRSTSNGILTVMLIAPTGSEARGLGDGVWSLELPIVVGRSFGQATLSGSASSLRASGSQDQMKASTLLTVVVAKGWLLGAELVAGTSAYNLALRHVRANVGFMWTLTRTLELQGLAGQTIARYDEPQVTQARLTLKYAFK